jgi:hypothetical protein
MRVLVDTPPSKRPRLVGAVVSMPQLVGWPDPTAPKIVQVVQQSAQPGALIRAEAPGVGVVTLLPPSKERPAVGHRYAAAPTRADADGVVTHVVATSSRLP